MEYQNKRIIFYDGYCILCSRFIRFIIKKDKQRVFRYTTIDRLGEFNLIYAETELEVIPDSIAYASGNKIYFYSDAVLKILYDLGGMWKFVGILFIIPKVIRNYFYKFIARNRYRIFGKTDRCFLPPTGLEIDVLNPEGKQKTL